MPSQQPVQNTQPTGVPQRPAQTGSVSIGVPEAFSPVVAAIVDGQSAVGPLRTPPGDRPWREVHLRPAGRCGADTKLAFHEGLRAGAGSIVVWPGELGPWQASVYGLVRPLFTRRADLVLTGYSQDAAKVGLRPLPDRYLWPASAPRRRFTVCGPLAITRRALDMVPFEANADGQLFYLQLLAQARHFALEVAPCFLSPSQYEVLGALPHSTPPPPLKQVSCGVELLAHRWGLVDSPRFEAPRTKHVSRWMISGDNT